MRLKTSGSFMLLDPHTGLEFGANETTETASTPFVDSRLANGDLVEVKAEAPAPAPKPAAVKAK